MATTLKFRRNPAAVPGDRGKPLVLDGEQQDDVRVALDGVPLAAPRAELAPGRLTIHDAPVAGTLTVASTIAPSRNVALEGLYL